MKTERVDTIIIGGGPAGVTCALELLDSRLTYIILERRAQLGGQLADIRNSIKNFPGGFFDNGGELRLKMLDLVGRLGCRYLGDADVKKAALQEKRVIASRIEFTAPTILLATGYRKRKLNLAGEDRFGHDVAYDISHLREHLIGHPVAVVGGGDSALLDALELAGIAPIVYIIHREPAFRARPDIVRDVLSKPNITVIFDSEVTSLVGSDRLTAVVVNSKEHKGPLEIAVERLVIKIGYTPNTELFQGQVEMDEAGHILIQPDCSTSCQGVYAAGDITQPGYPRIATAVGQGMTAACAIRRYLKNLR